MTIAIFLRLEKSCCFILYVSNEEKITHFIDFDFFAHFSIPQNSTSHSSSSEIDEGPAAKLARFTNDLIAESHQRIAINANQSKRKFYESTDENPTDDDDDVRKKIVFCNLKVEDRSLPFHLTHLR